MNKLKYLLLLVASVMILAACGTSDDGNGDNGNGEPEPGTLIVNVVDADTGAAVEADIAVVDSEGDPVDTQTGVSTFTWPDVEAGSYTVSVSNAEGYLDRLNQTVNVPAGDTVTYNAELTPVDESMADVDSLALDFVDVDDNAYDTNEEVNPVKDATLVAAQTEEQVGVSVLVTDENGDPVANAPVTVSVTGDFSDSLAIYPGYPVDVSAAAAQTFQGLTTDADGMAYFTIEATNADLTLQEILNFLLGEGFAEDEVIDVFEPIKLIVSATGGNNVAKRVEFKSFFTNMSHLWYGAGELVEQQADMNVGAAGDTRPTPGNYVEVLPDPDDEDTEVGDVLEYTDQRLGADLGTKFNIWSNQAVSSNGHYFGTYALTKQPSRGPYRVGVGTLSDLLQDGPVIAPLQLGYPSGLAGFFPGYMEYTLSGVSEDEDGNPLVEWDETLCENDLSVDPTTCVDEDGSGVGLVPVSGVSLEDLPIEATVEATYYFVVEYGQESYEFALKDYTFTKEWIGGFLTVDKHVDQHVLTWAGEEVTLPASSTDYDEEYRSTVHIEVSNDSDADIYNVTVRDAVPAELGVVEGTISNNGTYDPVNHVVTWNFNNTPSLESIGVGESLSFSFDVYARHKPGYCWEGTGDGSFNVQPRYGSAAVPEPEPEPEATGELTAAQDFTCDFAYEDPYRVTNGRQANSVTAAGFFEDSVEGEQLVFSYEPEADESDIWVVRPLLEIQKALRSQLVMTEGASATFGITARQIDRVSETVDPANTEYAFLNDQYPWEFTGALGTGTGHEADTSEVRDNPYARDVEVADAWEVGLDFTNGTDFTNVDGGDIDVTDAVVEKEVTWSPIDDLPRGTTAEAILTLTGNLLSDDGTGVAQNNSDADTGDSLQTVQTDAGERYFWENCAYLGSPQLNQPFEETGQYQETWYFDEGITPWTQYQIDGEFVFPNELVSDADPDADPMVTTYSDGAVGLLEDCAQVVVVPPPPTPFVTLTTNGEYQGPDESAGETGEPLIVDANLKDGYQPDEEFVYKMTVENAGLALAEDIVIDATLNNNVVRFNGTASLYIGGPGGPWTWNQDGSVSASTVTFSPVDLAPGTFIRVVVEARANQRGVGEMTTMLDYDNPPSSQNTPLEVLEETSVQ